MVRVIVVIFTGMSPPLGPPTLVCFGSKFAAKRAKTDGARCNGGLLPITSC